MNLPFRPPAGICVSIGAATVAQALEAARLSVNLADVIEIRLDTLSDPEIAPFIRNLSVPLLFTNRPEWEGGSFKGTETARVGLLVEAVVQGCALVDLELKTAPELRAELLDILLQHPQTGLIVSWHDFAGTPSADELAEILIQQLDSGAHIGKIVTTAHNYVDVLRILNLQIIAAENNFPLIAFCMGQIGKISRMATTKLGGCMTYAAPDDGGETAPGQIPVSALHDLLERLDYAD